MYAEYDDNCADLINPKVEDERANLEPLLCEGIQRLKDHAFQWSLKDYQKKIFLDNVTNKQYSNINEILKFLKEKYCGSLGYEYMHISNPTERKWFRERVE